MASLYLKGYVQILIASVLFGLVGIFIKLLINNMPLGSIIFYRLLFGFAAIVLYLTLFGMASEILLRQKKKYVLLLGLFYAGTILSYFSSVKNTTVSMGVLLIYTAPIYVTLLSPVILKERITHRGLVALALSITGVIIVIQPQTMFQNKGGEFMTGVVMGLISGLLYACMTLASRYLRNYYTGMTQATWGMIITMIVFSPYSGAVPAGVLIDNLYLLILFGLLPTAMSDVLYLNGLRQVKAQSASIIGLLEPVSAVLFAFIILKEPIPQTTILGGVLILMAVVISRESADGTAR